VPPALAPGPSGTSQGFAAGGRQHGIEQGVQLGHQAPFHQKLFQPGAIVVDEPTAAAIGAGLPPGSRVLVVDGGGGTFDLSLVALEGGEGRAAPIAQLLRFAGRDLGASGQALRTARVIGKAGVALGGRDLDRWIASYLCPDVAPDPALLTVAEAIKCRLSESEEALGLWVDPAGTTRELRLDRPRLEKLLVERGLVAQLDALLDSVLAAARSEALAGPAAIDQSKLSPWGRLPSPPE